MATGTLKGNGDQFERAHHEWIAKYLPDYESVWQRFIGNDGSNRPLKIVGLAPDEEQAHKLFYQSHYSLAVYSHLFERHADEAIRLVQQSTADKSHREIAIHLRDMKNLTLFVALLGQACDMVETISGALKDPQVAKAIETVFALRNNAIHAARIPVGADAYGTLIAPIARVGSDTRSWKKYATWDSVFREDFKHLDDWLGEARDEFFTVLKKPIYPMIAKAAIKRFRREVAWPTKQTFGTLSATPAVSASDAPRAYKEDPRWANKVPSGIKVPPSGDGRPL